MNLKRYNAKSNKPVMKGQTVYNSTYMKDKFIESRIVISTDLGWRAGESYCLIGGVSV